MKRRHSTPIRALIALCATALAWPALAEVICDPVYAVGDLHGGYDAFRAILTETELVDESGRWQGGEACLVQLGDVVDRGADSREILDLLIGLTEQAPERVHALMGNHELMNIEGDLRYVHPGELAAFADDETSEERAAGRERGLPPGFLAHRRAFGPDGAYGRWLLGRGVARVLNRTLFVHGGMTPEDARLGIDRVNERIVGEVVEYRRLRSRLERAGWLEPQLGIADAFARVEQRIAVDSEASSALRQAAVDFLGMRESSYRNADSPVWHRGFAVGAAAIVAPVLESVLELLDVDRIVVAHSTQRDGTIKSRFDERVFLIDTGAGPAYGGRPSALKLRRGGPISAVYVGAAEAPVEALVEEAAPQEAANGEAASGRDHAEIERFLLEAEIVETEALGTGVTKPWKVTLELDGETRHAVFKYVDLRKPGVTKFPGGKTEMNFSDSYLYDRAAYLIDRELGLDMVPVTVLRTVKSKKGALVEWIPGVMGEHERREQGIEFEDPDSFEDQRAMMRMLDSLVENIDRNQSNMLVDPAASKLWAIDYTRAFRTGKKLQDRFSKPDARITRGALAALEKLDADSLNTVLKGTVSKSQIKAMLKRRDLILQKIAADRERLGDDAVFVD